MLTERDNLPAGLLELDATRLHEVLPGPTLIHLPGRRPDPLFVSVLLHGNEDSGWLAVRALLREFHQRELPRALSLFIGNVQAARYRQRYLEGQPDFNRIWGDLPQCEDSPERRMMQEVVASMRRRRTFACIDIHTNTGINPHYACTRRLDHRFFHLAILFSRTVVYFTKPDGVQIEAFAEFCPAVTVECGQAGQEESVTHAYEYIQACLNLSEIPRHPVPAHDIDLFHTVAILKIPPDVTFGFDAEDLDIRLVENLDHLNFRELPAGTPIGWIRPGSHARIEVWDEIGRDVGERFLRVKNGEIQIGVPVMPSMLTMNLRAVRQDCLGYLMENKRELYEAATVGSVTLDD
jgi:succinylglutamate desuccinylase